MKNSIDTNNHKDPLDEKSQEEDTITPEYLELVFAVGDRLAEQGAFTDKEATNHKKDKQECIDKGLITEGYSKLRKFYSDLKK